MPHHYRRGDVSNTCIRAKLYSEGVAFDQIQIGKSLKNRTNFLAHTKEALEFQKNHCLYCQEEFNLIDKKPQRDHIRPMEQESAGLHTWGNILFCCPKCNKEKDRFPGGWTKYIESKPVAKSLIGQWQSLYNPGYYVSDGLIQICKSLYKEIDDLLRTHNII